MNQTPVPPIDSVRQSNLPAGERTATDAARTATTLVLVALLAALPLELLARAVPWGLNVPLMALTIVASLLYTTWRAGDRLRTRIALGAVLVALGAVLAWRGESLLWLAAVVGIVGTGTLLVMPGGARLRDIEPVALVIGAIGSVLQTMAGPLRLASRDIDWRTVTPRNPASAVSHLRGLAWSIVVVLPFLMLFAEADAVFAAHSRDLVDLPRLASHVVLWGVFAWVGTGWLGVGVLPWRHSFEPRARVTAHEATWVLGVLSLAFASFVAVQLRYFFGGADLVAEVTGLTYAEYARRGFFELVTVAALLLGVLLLADETTRDADAGGRRRVRGLSVVLVALLGVILVSALQRMRLYVVEYGLTELRFFATAFMLWLVVVFGWYCATVLRGARERFVGGVYVTGVIAVLALAMVDPIGRITHFNVEHSERTSRFDQAHALSLGADAVPVLVASIGRLPIADRCPVAAGLVGRWAEPRPVEEGWRSWNGSRDRAHEIVRSELPRLERMCGTLQPRTAQR